MSRSAPKLSESARHLLIPSGIVSSEWPRVRDLAQALLSIEFDRWQDGLGMLILAKRADGKYAAGVGGVVMSLCRQVGKTFLIGSIVFMLCILHPGLMVLWTAHRSRTSDETFGDMRAMAQRKGVRRHISRIRSANGQQEVAFSNGSRILFGARERGFGRGFKGVGVVIFDEAQILTETAMSDMVPAMNTADNGLLIMMGTPPKPGDPSEAFTARRQEALNDGDDMLYLEFSADPDADPDDRDQWSKANPSYPRRTPASSILRLQKQLSPDSFRREGLGIWDTATISSAIDPTQWRQAATSTPDTTGLVGYAIDMPPDRSSLAIGGCVKHSDGTAHIELKAFESTQSKGTAWAVDWIADRWSRTAALVIDAQSPAMALLPDLKARHVKVITTTATDMGRACGRMLDMLRDGKLTHLDDGKQPALDLAVSNATTRNIGSSGAVGWNKLGSDIDISPLVACTLALYGTFITKRRPGRVQKVMV
ncbi:phage terminase [Bifidobacterium actinocoloniiforme DSM 22766]|uniref:Phage terminase n=1 Tax=Bifidobacterium actinocoloniiforme DSM 22766 TaxID=1437605 RepID=A0A086YZV1_9BIFI|nr:terminase [Bifidobacterium actinocoloniiforme]AKV55087.1 terminase [Bifidobacterium actinocoloniiforme DSM 22766]KFI39801.1 phage terminase [Bifidobacterium actinocoloniiforme DSM 22766]